MFCVDAFSCFDDVLLCIVRIMRGFRGVGFVSLAEKRVCLAEKPLWMLHQTTHMHVHKTTRSCTRPLICIWPVMCTYEDIYSGDVKASTRYST